MTIGKYTYYGGFTHYYFYQGGLDQLSIWNTALSQSEIQQYMNCPPSGDETGLVGYWNFEEGSGTTALDLTANGNNGTINGASYDTDTPEQICNACSATDSVVVSILDPNITASAESVCFGDSVELSVSNIGGYSLDLSLIHISEPTRRP